LRIDRTNFALAASLDRARFYRIAAPAGKLRFRKAQMRTSGGGKRRKRGDGMSSLANVPSFYAATGTETFIRTLSGAELKI
jgi:hypothetical protein